MPKDLSSSSSSDEESDLRLQQLREAVVTVESLNKSTNILKEKSEPVKKSKRIQENEEDQFENICDVTPEFQEFVAKKLKSKLDE